jgi:Beta-galactosidase
MRIDATTRALVTGASPAAAGLSAVRTRILCLGVLLAVGAATPAGAAEPGTLQIGFWCGPPPSFSTPARFRQIEAAGFTFALPPCNVSPSVAENQAALAAAATTDVKVFIRDARIPASLSEPGATARLDAVIADYADMPAFAGYELADEPAVSALPGLGQVVAYLRARDPEHPAFINVFPNYGPYQGAAYEDYLERYATEAGTAMFSYDHYPFTVFGDRPEFFPNLHSLRALSLRFSRPFWQIGQATPHLAYTQPSEAQKRWQVFQSLAYGASGISYFTYWSIAHESFGPGIIGPDGTPTPQYREVQRINARAQAIGRYLVSARSTDVFQNPPVPGSISPRRPGTPVDLSGDAPVTAGVFETDDHVYVLLANRSTDASISAIADLSFGATLPQRLDPATGAWSTVRATVTATAARTHVTLAAGDGTLFRTVKPVPAGSLGPEAIAYRANASEARQCPANYTVAGQSRRFWLCARSDLATRGFYVNDARRSYRVQNGSTVPVRPARVRHCGRDGLRVCPEDEPRRSEVLAAAGGDGCPEGFQLGGVGRCQHGDALTRMFSVADAGADCRGYVATAGSWSCIRGR